MLLQQARFGALQECLRRYAVAVTLRRFSDSLHVSLEPLQDENEGIFSLTLSRPSARNAIGVFLLKYCGTLKLAARTPHIDSLFLNVEARYMQSIKLYKHCPLIHLISVCLIDVVT